MKVLHTRKFPTYEEAEAYLKERGTLEFFGTLGTSEDTYYVYNWHKYNGKLYGLFVYQSGKVEVISEGR